MVKAINWQETEEHLAELRELVNQWLDKLTDFSDDCPDRLKAAIRYSLLLPGKRFRPLLVLLAAEACGADPEEAIIPACAVEMIHCYSLIHDDLPAMDNDDLRRGQPTCHRQFDEATAILAGDALLTLSFEVLAQRLEPPDRAVRCCLLLAEAAGPCRLVGGQVDDIQASSLPPSLDLLERIHRRKTGALIECALLLGAVVGNANPEVSAGLADYGRAVGLAFQITDDLLDLLGDEKLVGKRVKKDKEQNKLTFPSMVGVEASRKRVEELIDAACRALEGLPIERRHLVALAIKLKSRTH
ncbi:MAG: polyprenyl synthetase family protein [Thermogutta sp.]